MFHLVLIIAIIILVLWLLGLLLHFIAGPLLYILLIVGIILLIAWLVKQLRKK